MRKPKPIQNAPDAEPSVRSERPVRPVLLKPTLGDEKNLRLTPEEQVEWEKYRVDLKEYLDAAFNMQMLHNIVLREKAPALQDTPAAREIVRNITESLQIRSDPFMLKILAHMKGGGSQRKAWLVVRRLVASRVRDELEGRASLQSSYRGALDEGANGDKVRRMNGLMASSSFSQLQKFVVAMDEIEMLLFPDLRAPGKRKSALIFDSDLPLRLSDLLSKAWFEAGMDAASKEKIYRIVKELLVCAGDKAVDVSAVKSAILRDKARDIN